MKIKILFRLLIVTTIFLILSGCKDETAGPQAVQQQAVTRENRLAPDFELKDVNGQIVRLSEFKGQVVILNFWATWCPPCREEMPSMEALHRKFADKGLVMIAVNVEENGPQLVPDFLRSNPYSFRILYDNEARVQNLYKVFRYPETFIIDRNGNIVDKVIGSHDWMRGEAYKLVDFLLNG